MSFRSRINVKETGYLAPGRVRKAVTTFDCEATGRTRPEIDRHAEYAVSLGVSTTIWANNVQLPHARDAAIRMLAQELYQDVHAPAHRLLSCLYSEDIEGAIECASEILEAIKP